MGPDEAGALERLLKRDRAVVAAGLAVLALLAWAYVLAGAGMGMSVADTTTLSLFPHKAAAMPMDGGMDGGAMGVSWTPAYGALAVAMWWVMMIAMMTPSAAPTVLLYARVHRHERAKGTLPQTVTPVAAFVAGYLLVWFAFSVVAAAAQFGLEQAGHLGAMTMWSTSRWLSAGVLIAAGLYQFTPWKTACLEHCRSPARFISAHWAADPVGAARMGAVHGAYCVGCCWALMALLFVGGVMNVVWVAVLAILVLVEKLAPAGRPTGVAVGVLLIVWGAATLAL